MKTADRIFCLCRADVSESASWFHTLPAPGEYPGGTVMHKGKPVKDAVIVIDPEAYNRISEAFKADALRPDWPGILVDREHFSLDLDKGSDALAWAKEIRIADDGIWTRWDLTPPGRDAWQNRVLVSRSPVLDLERMDGNRFRPVRIDSIAMTNTPHFDTLSTIAAARAAEEQGTATPDVAPNKGDAMDKQLLAELGLPETATVADAIAKVQALKSAATTSEAEMKKAEAACRKAKCDAFIAAHKPQIADEAKFREAYEKNPEATESAFGVFRSAPEKAPSQTRISARDAKAPDGKGGDEAAATRRTKQAEAVAAYRSANPGTTCREAEAICRRQQPALFSSQGDAE